LLTAFDAAQEMHVLQLAPDTTAREVLDGGRLVTAAGLAEPLALSEEDRVALNTPFGVEEFVLGPTTREMMSAVAYLSVEEARECLHAPDVPYNGLYSRHSDDRASRHTACHPAGEPPQPGSGHQGACAGLF